MAGRRREHAAYHIEYRCLSGSVGTDKPGNAALLHSKADAVHSLQSF